MTHNLLWNSTPFMQTTEDRWKRKTTEENMQLKVGFVETDKEKFVIANTVTGDSGAEALLFIWENIHTCNNHCSQLRLCLETLFFRFLSMRFPYVWMNKGKWFLCIWLNKAWRKIPGEASCYQTSSSHRDISEPFQKILILKWI